MMLISASEQQLGIANPERFRRLEIDHQLELGWLFNGQIARFGALEKFVHVHADATKDSENGRSVAPQPTCLSDSSEFAHQRKPQS